MLLLWIIVGVLVAIAVVALVLKVLAVWQDRSMDKARRLFVLRREWLEAEFLKYAGLRGIPRGLRWVECEFDSEVQFARDRTSRQLRALVAATIRFEAIEGGGMEDVEAVGNLRAATAIFFYDSGKWTTSGRALFNLNPTEAIQHYHHELELVD